MALFRHRFEPRPEGPSSGDLVSSRSRRPGGVLAGGVAWVRAAPEVLGLVALSAVLNLWALGQNVWANEYYSAAVRSMAVSWHDFLYASLDRAGVETVDKPPLSLWIQALSVRVFGFHPLAILVPQALMGVASVVLVYDLVRRRFGRVGGFVAGIALATTPIVVAMSRHNNPDELLTLLCTAAVWFAVRGFEDGRVRWIVLAGIAVGLGFETKMLVALVVVPAIALTYLWYAPRGRLVAFRQLLAGGGAMLVTGGAWPLLVALTPAADRPWISGTPDNSILSLIFDYNGFGRVTGQLGGPGGGLGNAGVFAGGTGPFRLLNVSLGGQAGWLLGLAIAGAVVVLVASRGRRRDPRTAWVAVVGGSFLATAVLFSIAQGIFHPYYVVLLAPFTAALVGAGVATAIRQGFAASVGGAALLVAGVVVELIVISDYSGHMHWLEILLPAAGGVAAVSLFVVESSRSRGIVLGAGVAALLIAPTIWAFDTLGYQTQGTFPAGGPQYANTTEFTGGGGGFGGGFARRFAGGGRPALFGGQGAGSATPSGSAPLFGPGNAAGGAPPAGGFGRGGGFGGGLGGQDVSSDVLAYVRSHGGGTIAVWSQSEAATAIIDDDANVAGIGGFTGAETDPSVSWLADEVASGHIRWVDPDGAGLGGTGGRPGATAAVTAAEQACTPVTVESTTTVGSGATTIYDCAGRAAALRALS